MHSQKKLLNYFILVFLTCLSGQLFGQQADSLSSEETKEKKIKKGWTFGALPAISFDTDVGFQYGALANFYNYGDGTKYPEYLQSIYIEWSRTTKGSGINRFYFDSEYLIPNIRVTADVSYLTEKAIQFFGFNGYDAVYNANWENDTHADYKSRVFYRHDRRLFRAMATFQGKLKADTDKFRWLAGFAHYNNKVGAVDIDNLNRGKDEADKLPPIEGLYDKYVKWGVLSPEEATGNKTTYLKAGLVYDSRDFEAFPTKGTWAEAVYSYAPGFLGDSKHDYSKLTLVLRQYFSLTNSKNLVLAYRLGYQGTITGKVPFHMQPHIVPTIMTSATSQGLGGASSLRGIMRNRVVGDGIALLNTELRWKFLNTQVFNQNLYLGTNLFADMGQVVQKIDVNVTQADMGEDRFEDYFAPDTEKLHVSTGLGLKVGLNDNFIVSIDYGVALDEKDGDSGLYIKLNWLY
ncbi:BamA/TamA family outer membrane protein [Flammeovirgaceae bacterium SG7u.111]|nr:BamA/TamA family outer membrane protein [Flammeovirgaceae bacterium SG7u.132]WPO33039.1 BamA/TamA family outer membrane protein [Flammeovirgaceae bacterium SG7u.111]